MVNTSRYGLLGPYLQCEGIHFYSKNTHEADSNTTNARTMVRIITIGGPISEYEF